MPSDYTLIRQENIREYGEGTRHLAFLGRLYPDRTHFIFELLQNAEDAGATHIQFKLMDDRLEVRHDGRPFNEKDVRGVCGVAEGTKADDFTQIGKFGIGFKSIYAYTRTPQIHSVGQDADEEHFQIKHYVRPWETDRRDPGKGWTTLQVLPFDHDEITLAVAKEEIAVRLTQLGARTLLFLHNINEIEYTISDGPEGQYLRETKPFFDARKVTVIGEDTEAEPDEEWLVFTRPVNTNENLAEVAVEVAFLLEEDGETIQRVTDSPLVVFFPTDKETDLGFLLQGPYRTTPARDNIPVNDEWNSFLLAETATLVVDALEQLRDMDLFDLNLLLALPIRSEDFPSHGMFYPIYEAVKDALSKKSLIPTSDGRFLPAPNVNIPRSDVLRNLLDPDQLRQFLSKEEEDVAWIIPGVTQNRTPDLYHYLLDELDIQEITPEWFAQRLTEAFLVAQSDEWMIEFYKFAADQKALWRKSTHYSTPGVLRNKPIIRLEDNSHVLPFDEDGSPNAFLGVGSGTDFVGVKSTITVDQDAYKFLKDLGLREVEAKDQVEQLLKAWYKEDSPTPTHADHLMHMKIFIDYWQGERNAFIFLDYLIFFDKNGHILHNAEEVYLDSPHYETGLSAIFDRHESSNDRINRKALWDKYTNLKHFVEFAQAAGVMYELLIQEFTFAANPKYSERKSAFPDGVRETYTSESSDYIIVGIDLSLQDLQVSKLIWQQMCKADPKVFYASYRPNKSYHLVFVQNSGGSIQFVQNSGGSISATQNNAK